jgi:dolichol-phosphate mannosyltransferase
VKLGIAIPTYNEAANVKKLIETIHKNLAEIKGLETTILIIDDGSPDGTADVVKKMANKYGAKPFKVKLMSRKIKDGLGKAYIAGFGELIKMKPDYILQMDADLSHDPVYIPNFVKAAKEKNDLIVGSRYIPGGETPDWSFSRRLQSQGGNFYTRIILGNKITDYTGGFNMFSIKLMKQIDPTTIASSGYGFLIDLKYHALQHANSIAQIPIVFRDRQHGKSKLPKSTIVKNLILVPMLKVRSK